MAEARGVEATSLRPTSSKVKALLKRLHHESSTQEAAIPKEALNAIRNKYISDPEAAKAAMDDLMRDKFIALDEDKSLFMYNLILSKGSRNVVEIGTSFGVSTIYLALAVRHNAHRDAKPGVVIATEKEAAKAAIARAYWDEAGSEVSGVIDLKEGDLTQILADSSNLPSEPIDFVLMDIWPYVALPALKCLLPHLRPGAVILSDNVLLANEGYREYLNVLNDPDGPFNNIVLPYTGGFQMSVYNP